ncbi:hypothetical protein ACFPA8_07065 [Streptomyces ovatisporus]|uniref:Uncharacterized protein n=1 Tax=Streptomyces ovatisporus TaxID=1128682 RepID=A0ABV9A2U7_9ACTN
MESRPLTTTETSSPKPAFWYGIPHGYHSVDLTPSIAQLGSLIEQVRELPRVMRGQAEGVLRFYSSFAISMKRQHVQVCLVGMHPDGNGGFPLSVLTVSTIPAQGTNAEMVVANMAGIGAAERPEDGIVPLRLPCGTGFLAERQLRTTAPGGSPEGDGRPLTGVVWQGTVAVAEPDRSSVILLQLVTPATDQADDYRDILVGVAHTVTFTDPYAEGSGRVCDGGGPEGHAAEAIRNDFG